MKPCKDCVAQGIATVRPAPHPGPRCATHHRKVTRLRKVQAHARTTQQLYGITAAEYWAIYEAQGKRCAICQRATGASKRLAVDHDHETGEVRALLCGRCNRLIAFLDADALRRAIRVLKDKPAQEVLIAF